MATLYRVSRSTMQGAQHAGVALRPASVVFVDSHMQDYSVYTEFTMIMFRSEQDTVSIYLIFHLSFPCSSLLLASAISLVTRARKTY